MTRAIVAGALANKPGNGGEAWVRANWVRGLERLGLDVWFVEQLAPSTWGDDAARCIDWFEQAIAWFGLGKRSVLVDRAWNRLAGDPAALDAVGGGADLLVNISGHLRDAATIARCQHRAYVDLDPAYTQIWDGQGGDLGVADHDSHFTVGLNVGSPGCAVPLHGLTWRPVLPPVLLDEWTPDGGGELDRFTTVASWRGGYGALDHDGVTYGAKAHEFRRFRQLPRHIEAVLEIALEIHPADDRDRCALLDDGWRVVQAATAVGDPDAYRSYVQASPAELSVAQPAYVGTRSGWFSDRTAHYLAAGRPALVQDTAAPLPSGDGLLRFSTLEQAVSGARQLCQRYEEHRVAARRFAEQHLDAALVLGRFLEQAGVG